MRKALPLLHAVLLLPGSGAIYRQPVYQGTLLEKTDVDQLREGKTPTQVIGQLGTPPVPDPFHNDRWDYLASERYSLPTTSKIAATEDLGLPVVDVPSESLRRGNDLFGGQGGGLFGPIDLKHLDLS